MLNFIVHKKKLQLPVFIYLLALSPLNFFSSLGKVLQMSESSSDDNDDDKNAELGDPPSVDTMMNSHQELQTLSNNFIHAVEKHTHDLTTATEEQRMLLFQQLKTTTSAYMQASKEPARRRKLATSEYGHWREKWVASQKSDDATKKHCSQKTMCHLADFNISDITGLVRTHRAVDLVVYKQQKEGLKKQKQQLKQQYEQNIDKHILDAFGRASAQLQNVDEHKVGIKRKAIEDRGVEIQRGQCPTISILQDVPQGSWHKIALDQSKIFESIYSSLLSFGVMTSEDLKKDATCGGHLQQVNNLIKQAHEMSSSFLPIVIASPALPLSSPPILTRYLLLYFYLFFLFLWIISFCHFLVRVDLSFSGFSLICLKFQSGDVLLLFM